MPNSSYNKSRPSYSGDLSPDFFSFMVIFFAEILMPSILTQPTIAIAVAAVQPDPTLDLCFALTFPVPPLVRLGSVATPTQVPGSGAVVIPCFAVAIAQLEQAQTYLSPLNLEKVDIPEESGYLDDSSASHHVLICREEPVSTIAGELLKPSEVMDALEGRICLDAGRWDSPNSSRADELETGDVRVQARMLDSGGVWSAVCVLMVAPVVIGMKAPPRSVSASENFTFDEEKDLPVADSFVDESRGSNSHKGLNPKDDSLDIVDEDGDVGWDWSRRCMDRISRLRKLMFKLAVGWIGEKAWISEAKKAPDRLGLDRAWSDLGAWLRALLIIVFLDGSTSVGHYSDSLIEECWEKRTYSLPLASIKSVFKNPIFVVVEAVWRSIRSRSPSVREYDKGARIDAEEDVP
ncbi:hypothetical protein F5887DRAFT_1075634 [Amanita rubescens]|nr:hypothetical protein F5887DRAFT_1075634 [Amanita rubescens]